MLKLWVIVDDKIDLFSKALWPPITCMHATCILYKAHIQYKVMLESTDAKIVSNSWW